ncbi:sterol desaturase family protein [Palleronia sp. KMU-117]|uniref:sterol desaturase family protein n=1 Tax=Palleronia sp. KMU-117 TaxID=3434108 RepID=UPI003D729FB3
MDLLQEIWRDLISAPFDMNLRISLFYLFCTACLATAVWGLRGRPQPFLRWLLPREVYRHRSNLLDIKLFLTNRVAGVTGILGAILGPTVVAYYTLNGLALLTGQGLADEPATGMRLLIATLSIVVARDFCVYWAHRLHHDSPVLWPFHAVHHSAEVLTPLTVTRAHPVETIIRNVLIAGLVGVVQALLLFFVTGQISVLEIGGANAIYFLFNALGSNLRHSHIWLSYGRVLEHIFISPAQHQIHHSMDVKHHNKNYGSIFAIWDWMFGTLYVPRTYEELRFGVADATGTSLGQPYPTLRAALIRPFVESWQALSLNRSEGAPALRVVPAPAPRPMDASFSLWLDVLRAVAAFAVLFGHMAHVRFTGGDFFVLREVNLASDAVIVFFVLSGLVIAHAASRDGTWEAFAFNRATRILSVVAPALLLTLVFDGIGTRIDPSAYPPDYYWDLPLSEFLLRGLTLTNQWQGYWDWVRLGTNGPLWSLSYEVAYYLMFGVALFLRGPMRWLLLALLALVAGLPILLLLPAWLIGVAVWRRIGTPGATGLPMPLAVGLALGAPVLVVVLKALGADTLLNDITAAAVSPASPAQLFIYSDEVLWNTVLALLVAAHLVGMIGVVARVSIRLDSAFARIIRWLAGGSFSLYIMHYPTLHLLDATLPESLPGLHLWMLLLTLAVCYGFAALFERPLGRFRAALRQMAERRHDKVAAASDLTVDRSAP